MLAAHRSVLMAIHRSGQAASAASRSSIATYHPTPPLYPVKNKPPGDAMIRRRQCLPHGRPLPSQVSPSPTAGTTATATILCGNAQSLGPQPAQTDKR